ncbi:hypothetical protein ZOSMA_196G00380 [Zostera marina]|uniref:PRONE domain-containing protein n=1 Tax=Zostera marina TaxID=29655 RepID=A0A0K9PP17_ZOSMR|nr:hypothetical protein ZOSMA_196G00380 [Zostera marina]
MISGEESTPGDDQVSSCSKEDAGGEPGAATGRFSDQIEYLGPPAKKIIFLSVDYLENFKDQNEFRYVSKDSDESEKANTVQRNDEKWWLPIVKVSVVSRKWLEFQKESVHKIFKAVMA